MRNREFEKFLRHGSDGQRQGCGPPNGHKEEPKRLRPPQPEGTGTPERRQKHTETRTSPHMWQITKHMQSEEGMEVYFVTRNIKYYNQVPLSNQSSFPRLGCVWASLTRNHKQTFSVTPSSLNDGIKIRCLAIQ